jgi:transposase
MTFWEINGGLWETVQNYLPPTKPHISRPRCDPRRLFSVILCFLSAGCSWYDVPANYGTISTVHRHHLELCEKEVYQAILIELLWSGIRDPEN